MTQRQRLLTALSGGIPDCVPVCPDFSNMIPAKLTGKPFWDIYLYHDPPLWQAYLEAAKLFDIDALWDAYYMLPSLDPYEGPPWEQQIVLRTPDRLVVQECYLASGKRVWSDRVDVYYRANPPTHGLRPEKVGLPPTPERWEPVEGVKPDQFGLEAFRQAKELLGDRGVIGVSCGGSCALNSEEEIYCYYDNPDRHEERAQERIEHAERRFHQLMALPVRLDFLSVGGSGTLIFQTVEIFRQLAFPAVKRVIELATAAGLPTHVHSCGPEKELVRIFAEETNLTVIDPLERRPMGDCNLAEIKRLYGDKIVLKGNLHTTDVMLRGSAEDVMRESKQAIDDAGAGGGFILSTGDQCGRDTPHDNIRAMVEAARTYGRY
jgi:uroporphyrinogen decarboxylase